MIICEAAHGDGMREVRETKENGNSGKRPCNEIRSMTNFWITLKFSLSVVLV